MKIAWGPSCGNTKAPTAPGAVNDLMKSEFRESTAQLGLANAAEVSDMQRNGYLKRPNLENNEVSLYFGLLEELRITATMTAVKLSPSVRKSDNNKQTRF